MLKTLPEFTLGWELEACRRASYIPSGVVADHDGSVDGDSMEYKINRNLVGDLKGNLLALYNLTTDSAVQVNQSCGFHVHIGMGRRTRQAGAWAAWFVQLARSVEGAAFEAVPTSRRSNSYCCRWKGNTHSVMARRYPREKYANRPDRYYWVNVVEMFRPTGIRTVEVRLLGGTHRWTYTLAWISACRLMAMSAWACLFDPSKLEGEANEMTKVFQLIRQSYLGDGGILDEAKTALYLASKAKIPLEAIPLDETENNSPELEVFREELKKAITAQKAAEKEALENRRFVTVGSTVCYRGDGANGNFTRGNNYIVVGTGRECGYGNMTELFSNGGFRRWVNNGELIVVARSPENAVVHEDVDGIGLVPGQQVMVTRILDDGRLAVRTVFGGFNVRAASLVGGRELSQCAAS